MMRVTCRCAAAARHRDLRPSNGNCSRTVEPAEKRIQVSLFGPDGGYTKPAIQLFLEDVAADPCRMLEGLLFGFPLRQEVNRRLPSQVFQRQFRTRWIHST